MLENEAARQTVAKESGLQEPKRPPDKAASSSCALVEAAPSEASPCQRELEHVLLGIPAGGTGTVSAGTAAAICQVATSKRQVAVAFRAASLLPFCFNQLVCEAINGRRNKKHPIQVLLLLHDDVVPGGTDWLDRFLDIMETMKLDVLSAIVPIKDQKGLTSTGLDTDRWRPRRLTMTEIDKMPETFTDEYIYSRFGHKLLVNTGLMAIRLGDWCKDMAFSFDNRIIEGPDGVFHPEVEPEDWRFSRWCAMHKLRYGATRAIRVIHLGTFGFGNTGAWGEMEVDTINTPDNIANCRSGYADQKGS